MSIIKSNNWAPRWLPKWAEKLCPHMYRSVYNSSFVIAKTYKKLGFLSVGEWVNKMVHSEQWIFFITKNKLSYWIMKRNKWKLKIYITKWEHQSEKPTYYVSNYSTV